MFLFILLLLLLIIIVDYEFVLLVDTVPGSRFFHHGLILDGGACRAFPHGVARPVRTRDMGLLQLRLPSRHGT